jgi:hypothetical protein
MSDPTYGTGTPASEQLVSDLSGVMSLGPNKKREAIDYEPRPDLVRPSAGEDKSLPAPQQKLASVGNAEWPESPEATRARLKAEITANKDNPAYESPIVGEQAKYRPENKVARDEGEAASQMGGTTKDQRAEINRRLAEQRQGSSTNRKYLSEPPLSYREAASTAAQNDVGEDELKKERRRKAEARKKAGGGNSWRDLVPGL